MIFKRLWCGWTVGHRYFWSCEEQYSPNHKWNLMSIGTCIYCGHQTKMKKVVGK